MSATKRDESSNSRPQSAKQMREWDNQMRIKLIKPVHFTILKRSMEGELDKKQRSVLMLIISSVLLSYCH